MLFNVKMGGGHLSRRDAAHDTVKKESSADRGGSVPRLLKCSILMPLPGSDAAIIQLFPDGNQYSMVFVLDKKVLVKLCFRDFDLQDLDRS